MSIVGLRNLCTPAVIYLAISMLLLVVMYIQNRNNVDVYCLGAYECDVTNVTAIFLVKFVYILFWTWILNLICGNLFLDMTEFVLVVDFHDYSR